MVLTVIIITNVDLIVVLVTTVMQAAAMGHLVLVTTNVHLIVV